MCYFFQTLRSSTPGPWYTWCTCTQIYLNINFCSWLSCLLTSDALWSSFAHSMIFSWASSLASSSFLFSFSSFHGDSCKSYGWGRKKQQKCNIWCWSLYLPPAPLESLWPLTLSTWRSSSAHSRISFLLSSRLRSARRSELGDPRLLLPSSGSEDPCGTQRDEELTSVMVMHTVIDLLLPDKSCRYNTFICFHGNAFRVTAAINPDSQFLYVKEEK